MTKARPLFPGHYQPHVPGELGYYDLRVPEVREAQAELAAATASPGSSTTTTGSTGRACSSGPFDEVLASGSPDFPFALCWANEEWTRNWDAQTGQVLMPQEFSDEDDLAHIRWLATAFADDRYIKIDGRPLMLIYRAAAAARPEADRRDLAHGGSAARASPTSTCAGWRAGDRRPAGPRPSASTPRVGFMPLERRAGLRSRSRAPAATASSTTASALRGRSCRRLAPPGSGSPR